MANILKNSDIIDCWFEAPSENKTLVIRKYVEQKIGDSCINKKKLQQSIFFFNSKMKKLWKECNYNRQYFEKKHSKWLGFTFFAVETVSLFKVLIYKY